MFSLWAFFLLQPVLSPVRFPHPHEYSLKTYLEQGGCLFISGSEIGWDLSNKGSAADKAFYNNYLKAVYVADDAGVETVVGEAGSISGR